MPKLLILAANPTNTNHLRLDEELRDIDEGLRRAQHRDQFILAQRLAVRPRDIQRAMLDAPPQIVHFSGHGQGLEGLVFEDETGQAKLVSGEALADLFALFADPAEFPDPIQCVVLNGCYSQVQAEAIAEHVPYVIGMTQAIGDRAAIEFAVGFYDALGAGRSMEFAFKLGCAAISLAGKPESVTPVLIHKKAPSAASNEKKVDEIREKLSSERTSSEDFDKTNRKSGLKLNNNQVFDNSESINLTSLKRGSLENSDQYIRARELDSWKGFFDLKLIFSIQESLAVYQKNIDAFSEHEKGLVEEMKNHIDFFCENLSRLLDIKRTAIFLIDKEIEKLKEKPSPKNNKRIKILEKYKEQTLDNQKPSLIEWLEKNKIKLSEKAGKKILMNHPELKMDERKERRYFYGIQRYLSVIIYTLEHMSNDLMADSFAVAPWKDIPIILYKESLFLIKNDASISEIGENSSELLGEVVDDLIEEMNNLN